MLGLVYRKCKCISYFQSESCASTIPLEIIKCLLPIPFFIFYVRRSFKLLEKLNNRETICCPGCLGIGDIPELLRYSALRCTKCLLCFCSKCGSPPHHPLRCMEAEYWVEKFKQTGFFLHFEVLLN